MIKKISVLLLSLLICITPLLAYATTSDGNFALLDKNGITVPDTLTYLDERNGWISNGQNLIENFYSCTSPETVYVPEWDVEGGYPYRMFFYGWAFTEGNNPAPQYDYEGYPGGDAIFCARAESIYGPWQVWSMDPSTKEGYWDENMQPYFWCPVFTCSTDPSAWYDNHHIADATVVWADGRFHLMASSQGSDVDGKFGDFDAADTDGYSGCAVGAVSSDGISWTKAEGPLLVWENEKGFDENAVGGWYTGKGYYGALGQPSLLYDDGVWKCWFTYNASVMSARWGYAENHGDFLDPDDWQFIKYYDDPTNILGSTDFDVIKIGDKYHAFANTWINYYGLTYDYLDNYPHKPCKRIAYNPFPCRLLLLVPFGSRVHSRLRLQKYFLPSTALSLPSAPMHQSALVVCFLLLPKFFLLFFLLGIDFFVFMEYNIGKGSKTFFTLRRYSYD